MKTIKKVKINTVIPTKKEKEKLEKLIREVKKEKFDPKEYKWVKP